jgi:hypothetical protein
VSSLLRLAALLDRLALLLWLGPDAVLVLSQADDVRRLPGFATLDTSLPEWRVRQAIRRVREMRRPAAEFRLSL